METPALPINQKTLWWREHKNDPRIVECMREARRKYYYKNHEKEKARSLARYYNLKAVPPAMQPPLI
jgi:hypothetical protein